MKVKKVTVEEKVVRQYLIPYHVDTGDAKTFGEITQQVQRITEQSELLQLEEQTFNDLKVEDADIDGVMIDKMYGFYSHLKIGG